MPGEIPQPVPSSEVIPHPNRVVSLMASARDSIASRFHNLDFRPSSNALIRTTLGLGILTGALALAPSASAQEVNNGQGVTVAGVSLSADAPQAIVGGEPPDTLLGQAEPIGPEASAQPGPEVLSPAQLTDVLSMPSWTKKGATKLPNGAIQISAGNGTEARFLNTDDSITVGGKGFEVQVKMNTVNRNNPTDVKGSLVLLNGTFRDPNPLQVEIGLDGNNNVSVHSFDFYHPVQSQRSQYVVRSSDGIRASSDQLRIQFVGSGSDERINIFDGANDQALAEGLQLPRPFFAGDGPNPLYFGLYPSSMASGPVMTVSSLSAGSL